MKSGRMYKLHCLLPVYWVILPSSLYLKYFLHKNYMIIAVVFTWQGGKQSLHYPAIWRTRGSGTPNQSEVFLIMIILKH